MPITENVNGVLHTHSVELENVGGVIREKDYVHANDGGVLHEIHSANKGATVSGITPLVVAEDHIVIVNSGSFTLSAPAGTRIIVGGAAQGTTGGNVAEYTLESAIRNAQCTVQCGAVNSGGATTLTISGTTYNSGSVKQIIQSKWGPIGGEGGNGEYYDKYATSIDDSNPKITIVQATGGTGAGGGGAAYSGSGGLGGNYNGYGNKGENGKCYPTEVGGKGGYSAGGGNYNTYVTYGYHTNRRTGSGGSGGAGIIVIEW